MNLTRQRTEAVHIGRAVAFILGLWLIAAGLLVGANGSVITGADLIAMPLLCAAGLWLIVRVAR